jgi:hypothetical protein
VDPLLLPTHKVAFVTDTLLLSIALGKKMYVKSALFLDILQHIVVHPYRSFGTTSRFHPNGSVNPLLGPLLGLLDPSEWDRQIFTKRH